MTKTAVPARSGQTGAEQASAHILLVLVEERPGSVDRVVSLLRRRRANMQTLVLGRTEVAQRVRITIEVNDSEVGIEQLVEQLRKVIDVQQVQQLPLQKAIVRELALIRVNFSANSINDAIDLAQQFGAAVVDVATETLTFEISGSVEKVEHFVTLMGEFGIREVAYSGRVALARGVFETQNTREQ